MARADALYIECGYGGIGRRAGFRFLWATVQVQLLLSAPNKRAPCGALLFGVSIQELRRDKQPAGCAGRRHLPPTKQWKPTVFRAPRSSGNSCYPHQDKKSTFSENRKCRLFFM